MSLHKRRFCLNGCSKHLQWYHSINHVCKQIQQSLKQGVEVNHHHHSGPNLLEWIVLKTKNEKKLLFQLLSQTFPSFRTKHCHKNSQKLDNGQQFIQYIVFMKTDFTFQSFLQLKTELKELKKVRKGIKKHKSFKKQGNRSSKEL